ncbi:MAG TPA: hypothetical protein VGP82_00465 [Ktedonobacterales bacterium]|nr:hypothetical protein [Ktedonobacterales bacterium]
MLQEPDVPVLARLLVTPTRGLAVVVVVMPLTEHPYQRHHRERRQDEPN